MSFNCQQNLSHYFNDSPPFISSFAKSSSPTILPHHQNQHVKLSPSKFCMSPASSPSLSLNATRAASGTKSTSETFCAGDDDENQPLDLSIHPNRDEQTLKRSLVDEHKPVCMVKSCTCNVSSPQCHHLARYSISGSGVAKSPNQGMTMPFLNSADSPFLSQQQRTSSAYNNCSSSTAEFSCYIPQPPQPSPWTTTVSSSFQHLTTSDNVLNGAHNPSSLYRPYDDHIDQDMNIILHEQQQASLLKQHVDLDGSDDDDEPTYMDLDSATTMPLNTSSRSDYPGNTNFMYGNTNVSLTSSSQNRTEDKVKTLHSSHQSTLMKALNKGINLPSSDVKSASCFVGGVISHTSLEKRQKVCSSPTNVSASSEHVIYKKRNLQQQMHFSQSSPPLSSGTLLTGHPTYHSLQLNTPQTTLFQSKATSGHPYSSYATDTTDFSKVTPFEPQSPSSTNFHQEQPGRFESQSPSSTNFHQEQPGSRNTLDKSKNNINISSPGSATNLCQQPISARTSISPDRVNGSEHRRAEGPRDNTSKHQAQSTDNETSTKISLLDFWISKMLMERSSEVPTPSKPCNVDYICTASGEKKIRLRLVDLMELQVEQSLKA